MRLRGALSALQDVRVSNGKLRRYTAWRKSSKFLAWLAACRLLRVRAELAVPQKTATNCQAGSTGPSWILM
jgi:hypothetical protein